jgi:cytochrome P450
LFYALTDWELLTPICSFGCPRRKALMMTLDQIDLADLDFFVNRDIHEAFRALRREDPVNWQERQPGRGFWSLTKYDDILAVYRDPLGFSSAQGVSLYFGEASQNQSGLREMMITNDPPRHPKMRQVVSRRFTPHAVAPSVDLIRRIAREIIDDVCERGECDFVVDVAAKLPTAAICEMMGIAREHWDLMFSIANQTVGRHDEEYARGRSGRDSLYSAMADGHAFFVKEAEYRRLHPGTDLVSAFVHGAIAGEPLTKDEIAFNCILLVLGGQETTRNATSGAMQALIEYPSERAKFTSNPSSVPAIEEFLRWTSPVTHIMRIATRDAAIRGKHIRQGDRVVLWNASANRDPDQFVDPDRFDLTRAPNDHLAFGHGEHFCLGANLARLEMRVMFEEVLRRIPDIELAGPVERLRSNFVAGIKHMPVRFSPRSARQVASA